MGNYRELWLAFGFLFVIGPQALLVLYPMYLILRRPLLPKRYEITSTYGFQIVYSEALNVRELVKEAQASDWLILSSPKGNIALHSDFGKNILSIEEVGEPDKRPRGKDTHRAPGNELGL